MNTHAFLIDDDPIQLKLGELLIDRHRIFNHITCFTRAFNALKYLTDHRSKTTDLPNVIITDLDMPELSGWDFLYLFKDMLPLLKKPIDVFVVSSSLNIKATQQFKQYPFVKGTFLKPISLITLHKITHKHIIKKLISIK